jgi:electron transport complex protein RnfE
MEVGKLKLSKIFKNGIIKDNPIFVQLIGMCSVLAVTTSAKNGLAMGLAVTGVLIGSNVVISLLRKVIPDKIRIPAFIVVIATFVTIVEMFMKAYTQDLYNELGIFIPLIVVNCIILARAEAFASKNNVLSSAVDGLGMGLGYTMALLILGSLREILGAGSIFDKMLFGPNFEPALIFIMPPGAFILLGILIAIFNNVRKKKETTEA